MKSNTLLCISTLLLILVVVGMFFTGVFLMQFSLGEFAISATLTVLFIFLMHKVDNKYYKLNGLKND